MDDWLHYLPLLNVLGIPAFVLVVRAAIVMERVHAFMKESKADREKLWATVTPMEREMLKRGLLDAS